MLQYLNSTKNIDKSIVTLNINTFSKYNFKNPHTLETFKKVIDKLQESKPRFIFIMMEPSDLLDNYENKKAIFDYLVSQKNVYLNQAEASNRLTTFQRDPIFKNYPNFLEVTTCGEIDTVHRWAILFYYSRGIAPIIAELKVLGFNPKEPDFYEYGWDYWETKQAFVKSFKLGTFGNCQTDDLLDGKIQNSVFANKNIFIGTNDEWTHLTRTSIFSAFERRSGKDINKFEIPYQDTVASLINFHTTGDYVKKLSSVNDMYIVFFLLFVLVFLEISHIKKFYTFLALIPIILIFEVIY